MVLSTLDSVKFTCLLKPMIYSHTFNIRSWHAHRKIGGSWIEIFNADLQSDIA